MLSQKVAPATFGEAAVLAGTIVVLAALCIVAFRRAKRPWLWVAPVGYNLLLLFVYMTGLLLYNREYGPVSVIAVSLTMPWWNIVPVDWLDAWLFALERKWPGFDPMLALLVGVYGAINTAFITLAVRVFVYPGWRKRAEGSH